MNKLNFTQDEILSNYQCKIHKKNVSDIFISEEQVCFICYKCKQDHKKYPQEKLVNFEDILSDDEIITNFPPFEEEDFYINYFTDLNSKLNIKNYQTMIDQNRNELESYLISIKQIFDENIEKVRQDHKGKFVKLEQSYFKIFEIYEEISSKQELKKIILNNEENFQDKVKIIVDRQYKNISENTRLMKNQIDTFFYQASCIQFDQFDKIKEMINDISKKIDCFNGLEFDSEEQLTVLSAQEDDNDSVQILEDNYASIPDMIFNLISNKTNYCSEEFLNQIKKILEKYEVIFDDIRLCETFYDYNKQESFSKLNDEQLERIRQLSLKISSIDKKYQNRQDISSEIQFNSYNIFKNLFQSEDKEQNQKFKQLLKDYPIFDLKSQSSFDLIPHITFNELNKLQLLTIVESNRNKQIFKNANLAINELESVICNTNLNSKSNYKIKIELTTFYCTYAGFNIGIINNKNQNDFIVYSNLKILDDQLSVIPMLSSFAKQKKIEVRINISKNIFKIATLPNFETVIKLNVGREQFSYNLCLQLYFPLDKIRITGFDIVDEFDNEF